MLTDLLEWFKRNIYNMNEYELRKSVKDLKLALELAEKQLNKKGMERHAN